MSIFDNFFSKDNLKAEVDLLMKADADDLPLKTEIDQDEGLKIGRKAIVEDPFFEQQSQHTLFRYRLSRLSNKTLKDVSLRDWLVSAIIQNRVDTFMRFSRPQLLKFDMGYRFVKKDDTHPSTAEEKEIKKLESFIYNCGRTENVPAEDRLLFGEFLKMVIRDALTFGHITIEKIKTKNGALHRFRPLPAEQVYHINKTATKEFIESTLAGVKQIYKPTSNNDPRTEEQINEVDLDYYRYVQMAYDNRPLAIFGDEDLIFKLLNPQNFADSAGYCYGPTEMAIINITNHLNTDNYNANFFTHGQAAKGVLHLKGTVTQSQLGAFRRQFYNVINGAQNAWRTPIIAGLDDVQWVPMAGGSKEMEYLTYNQNLMRAICTQFQIDPLELGQDVLATGGKTSSGPGSSTQEKLDFSRERGLYPLMMFIEDLINRDVIPAIDPSLSDKYKFQFEGYTDNTPQTEVALLQAEMTVHKSMNDLLKVARKEKLDLVIADLPMNEAFWGLVRRHMTMGEIREFFLDDKDASKRKELQYIPDDPSFLGWQQQLLALDQMKAQEQAQAAEAEQAQAQAQHQQEMEQGQHSREQEAHDQDIKERQALGALGATQQGKSQHDIAKAAGATSAGHVGGKTTKNPLNQLD